MIGYMVYILHKKSGYLVPYGKGLYALILRNTEVGKLVY